MIKFEYLVSFKTIAKKEIVRIMRIWTQTLVPSVITLSLYFVIFGALIGPRVGEMGGVEYISFIVPGLIMMAVILGSYTNVSSSFFGAKFSRSIEELLVSPTPNYIIILGYIMGGIYRGLLIGFLVTMVSLFFSELKIFNMFILFSIVLLSSIVFSLAGLINGIFARKFDDVALIPTFLLTPLIYLGGVFYSVDLLSPFWRFISELNPILYMVNAFRYGFLGISDVNVIFAFIILGLFSVALFMLCLYGLSKSKGIRQ